MTCISQDDVTILAVEAESPRDAAPAALSSQNMLQFLAILAHELRNPLAAITSAIYLQDSLAPDDVNQAEARKIIGRQTKQITRIVEDLTDVSRIVRGELSINREPCDVATVVMRAVETAQPNIEAARHTLEISLPAETLRVNGDEMRLTQVLINVLTNAARYTDSGGRIFIKAERTSSTGSSAVRISVRDTGRGIERELLPAIFGMFVQADNPAHLPVAGLGIGLALAKSIVELHAGAITAHSDGAGLGAKFDIILPLLPAESTAAAAQSPILKSVTPAGKVARQVLVFDAKRGTASMLAALIRSCGHNVVAMYKLRGSAANLPES